MLNYHENLKIFKSMKSREDFEKNEMMEDNTQQISDNDDSDLSMDSFFEKSKTV